MCEFNLGPDLDKLQNKNNNHHIPKSKKKKMYTIRKYNYWLAD